MRTVYCSSCLLGRGCLPAGVSVGGGVSVQGGVCLGGVCSVGCLPGVCGQGVCVGGVCPVGCLLGGSGRSVCPGGVCLEGLPRGECLLRGNVSRLPRGGCLVYPRGVCLREGVYNPPLWTGKITIVKMSEIYSNMQGSRWPQDSRSNTKIPTTVHIYLKTRQNNMHRYTT